MTRKGKVARFTAAGAAVAAMTMTAIGSPAMAHNGSTTVTKAATNWTTVSRADTGSSDGNGTAPFTLTYGASIVTGTVTFTNRSVTMTGDVKAVSDKREAELFASNADQSCTLYGYPSAPVGTTSTFTFSQSCPMQGGFSSVTVFFPE